jgi:hypothetical protein
MLINPTQIHFFLDVPYSLQKAAAAFDSAFCPDKLSDLPKYRENHAEKTANMSF